MNLNTPVSEIMSKQVVTLRPSQKLLDVKHIFEKTFFHHHIPVVEASHIVGIISLMDFLAEVKLAGLDDAHEIYQTRTVEEIMSKNPVCKASNTTLREACEELVLGNVHALLIVDDKRLTGILSTSDVLNFILKVNP